jgi:hypothetical protein
MHLVIAYVFLLLHLSSFVALVDIEWRGLGPFTIGKAECDADPLTKHSELVSGGPVVWKSLPADYNGAVTVDYSRDVDFEALVGAAGREVLQMQTRVEGKFSVLHSGYYIVRCAGVTAFYVDQRIFAGDVYHAGNVMSRVWLDKGRHRFRFRLRAEVRGQFTCTVQFARELDPIVVFQPSIYPQVVDFKLASPWIALPIFNNNDEAIDFKDLHVGIVNLKNLFDVEIDQSVHAIPRVFSGQNLALPLKLKLKSEKLSICHPKLELFLRLHSKDYYFSIDLQCRNLLENSFIFTFIDHDNSIQRAAAIAPHNPNSNCYQNSSCPVIIALHGTGVKVSDAADAFKFSSNGKMKFGFPDSWLVAPSRHGAHNWETTGHWTALKAMESLVQISSMFGSIIDTSKRIYVGHSMGGHGALLLAVLHPDSALCAVPLHGWLRKDSYGHANRLWVNDIGKSYLEANLKAILEEADQEWNADTMVSNLIGIPILARSGSIDKTVHSWELRRFTRLMRESEHGFLKNRSNSNLVYKELKGKDHWFWDSISSNDGGVVNDLEVRTFIKKCIERKYEDIFSEKSLLVVFNPSTCSGKSGIKIIQQELPFRKSAIEINFLKGENCNYVLTLKTKNVKLLKLNNEYLISKRRFPQEMFIDGQIFSGLAEAYFQNELLFRNNGSHWNLEIGYFEFNEKNPDSYGPSRQILSKPFAIVIDSSNSNMTKSFLNAALYLANEFWMTSYHGSIALIYDYELDNIIQSNYNLIKISDSIPSSLSQIPGINMSAKGVGYINYHHGTLYLGARSVIGLQNLLDCAATPTIPPMTRSPFTYLIPDVFIVGEYSKSKGYGGVIAAGFWGNQWNYLPHRMYT